MLLYSNTDYIHSHILSERSRDKKSDQLKQLVRGKKAEKTGRKLPHSNARGPPGHMRSKYVVILLVLELKTK